MPWNPNIALHSELRDHANQLVDDNHKLVPGQAYTYRAERDPSTQTKYKFAIMTEASYAKDEPTGDDFVALLPCQLNPAKTELYCTFTVPSEVDAPTLLLGFVPDPEVFGFTRDRPGYGGDRYELA